MISIRIKYTFAAKYLTRHAIRNEICRPEHCLTVSLVQYCLPLQTRKNISYQIITSGSLNILWQTLLHWNQMPSPLRDHKTMVLEIIIKQSKLLIFIQRDSLK